MRIFAIAAALLAGAGGAGMRRLLAAAALLAAASPAAAEVKSAAANGFALESKVVVPAGPMDAWRTLTDIGSWWDPAHTFTGDAANLRLEPRIGGCFCELIPDGSGAIEHLRVVYVLPAQRLRLQGGLGPLQEEGATGALTWKLRPVEGGTEIVLTYVVGGYIRAGGERFAPIVDKVLAQQLERLAAKLRPAS